MSISLKVTNKYDGKDNLLLIGNKANDFEEYLNDTNKIILKRALKNDQKLVFIPEVNHSIIAVIVQPKEKGFQTKELCRKIGDQALACANQYKLKSITIINLCKQKDWLLYVAEGMALGSYQFLKYKKEAKKLAHPLQSIQVAERSLKNEIGLLNIGIEATAIAKDLVNEPLSYLTAVQLSKEIKKIGKEAGYKSTILDKAAIKEEKMGGLIAVNQGGTEPPTFSIMEWKPKDTVNKKPIVLVGKGIVYDTGGLSLKSTPNSMDKMKCDMAGSAIVIGAMYAVAKASLPLHVIGLVPATENRPGGNAYVPGDVITMHNGATVEVLNTDAEGRLVLADALSYAKRYKPELVMDAATLTGAAARAIGHYGIVYMGNASDKVKKSLLESGEATYERLVEFPMWEEYEALLNSDVADMKNVAGPIAGATTAGFFLKKYTDYPWLHFDIAGPSFIDNRDSYRGKHATGMGTRLLFDFLKKEANGRKK